MKRKIRMGMLGGGPGSFIGPVHRIAANLDGLIELVCGCFSSNREKSEATGRGLCLPPERIYASYEEMIERESALPESERMDFLSIVTPNHLHFAPAAMAMRHGFHVALDKPMTFSLEEALERAKAAAEMLSSRTLFLERMMEMPARIYDVPLPLAASVDEIERRKRDGRSAYERLSSEIASLSALSSNLSEQSAAKRKKLSKSGLDIHDHSGKAAVDGARLTGKDRSLDDQRRRVDSQARHKREMIEQMEKPLMRKTGIDLDAGGYIPSLSFPAAVLDAGGYSLHVPSLSIPPGEHIGITGCNGSGKTLLVRALVSKFISEGKGSHIIYIPQEYDRGQADAIISKFSSLSDCDRGRVVSDIYRMGSDPSFLLSADISPSPGELKKLDFILSRYDGRNIIVMDEPTNHLDIVSAGIFEKMLAKEDTSFSLLLVSHDEMFISRTCSIRWAVVREGSSGKVLAASSIQ